MFKKSMEITRDVESRMKEAQNKMVVEFIESLLVDKEKFKIQVAEDGYFNNIYVLDRLDNVVVYHFCHYDNEDFHSYLEEIAEQLTESWE